MAIESEIVAFCIDKSLTIGSAESLTAGLFCSKIASVPGASSILKGGFVTYFTAMKIKMLDVPPLLIEKYGVISKECARAMALNAQRLMKVDYAISFTGNAGPSAMEGKPAGRIYCAIVSASQNIYDFEFQLDHETRNEVRDHVVELMLHKLMQILKEEHDGEKSSC